MPHLRLVTDEPEIDPPAPLPIDAWRRAEPDHHDTVDPIAEVERALTRVQSSLDELNELVDQGEPLPFPARHDDDDDDGPWAA